MNNLNILPCKDTYDSYVIKNGEYLPKLPSKICIIGKSAISGKTTTLSNLINRPEYFGKLISGDDIYLVSNSINSDDKIKNIIKFKEIPEENLFTSLDTDTLEYIIETIKEKYNESISENTKPRHSIVIFDDISYDNLMSNSNNEKMGELVCNMRHYLTTTIFTAQKVTQLSRTIRANGIYFMIFKQPLNECETIAQDICYIDKKVFKALFNKYTSGKHDIFICNLDADKPNNMYLACGQKTGNCISSIIDIENKDKK